jgi:hypothetical protein
LAFKGSKRGWRQHNKEIHDLCSSLNIIMAIKSRMRWVEHVVHMGKKRNAYRFLVRNVKEGEHLEDPGICGKIILK